MTGRSVCVPHGIETNMNSYVIREATPTDVPALARLHVATFNADFRGPKNN
jgi:hypothetical protein